MAEKITLDPEGSFSWVFSGFTGMGDDSGRVPGGSSLPLFPLLQTTHLSTLRCGAHVQNIAGTDWALVLQYTDCLGGFPLHDEQLPLFLRWVGIMEDHLLSAVARVNE